MKPLHHLLLALFAPFADAVRLLRKPHLRAGAIASNQWLETKLAFKMKTKLTSLITIVLLGPGVLIAQAQVATEAWVQRYSPQADLEDKAQKVIADASGNMIVAGYTSTGITGADWLIIKYSAAGLPLWTNRYNGPGNDTDQAAALAVGTNGTVILTGYSRGSSGLDDYATIAYSGTGVPLWTNRYNGPGNNTDQATAVAVGTNGNVLVTGYSSSGSSFDYLTIAYSGAGVPLWTNRYNGPGNNTDQATAVAVSTNGNVFVTGYSYDSNGYSDYATVAYSGLGVPLWTNRFDGLGNNEDRAAAVAVDGSGDVFVTGYSYSSSSSTSSDYATIAYNTAGVPLWTNRYDGLGNNGDRANALVVSGSGGVFVTGYSYGVSGQDDYVTLAYSGMGVSLWTNRYNGISSGPDYAQAVALDSSRSNVVVAGFSYGGNSWYDYATVAYSGEGVPLWTNRYNQAGSDDDRANALAMDSSGNVFVTGYSYDYGSLYDCATVAYSWDGMALWTNLYNGTGNNSDQANAVTVDGSGKAFVTGTSQGSGSFHDYATVAYSGAGVPLWTNRYNGPGNNNDEAVAMTVGGGGNLFVTGSSVGNVGGGDYATVAYSGLGLPLWTNRYDGPANNFDGANAITVNNSSNVFVTGSSYGSFSGSDYATMAYSGLGLPLWTNRYDGPANSYDQATAVAAAASGNVFVTGYSFGNGGSDDYATIAYSGAGVPLWTNRYDGPANSTDQAQALAVGANGNVYVTGYSYASNGSPDYLTVAYSELGVPLWTNRYNGPGHNEDKAAAVAVDGNGSVFVSGYSYASSSGASSDFATVAYSGGGSGLWTNRYNGQGNSIDKAAAVAVDASGIVFVTGYSFVSGNSYDFATVAYSGAGAPLWTNRYNGPANGYDQPSTKQSLAIAPDGLVVIGGSDGDFGGSIVYDYAVVKYVVSFSQYVDSDGDGLNDLAEEQLAALGFNWQSNNTALVGTLYSNAATAGLFTQQQLQGLAINSPLIARDSGSGLFKLTIGVQKSTNLINFVPFPMTAPQTSINATGQVEFQFASSNGAALYRLEAQ